jgi:2-haloacid dehalogenase
MEGVHALRRSGRRLVTLTNGATQVAERLLGEAGLRADFERLLSVQDAAAWKPARSAYEYAAHSCGTELAEMLLVAVHPWDIDGAARAGMTTAWINRTGAPYPDYFTPPTVSVSALPELAERLS